jgi:hypothetical protein
VEERVDVAHETGGEEERVGEFAVVVPEEVEAGLGVGGEGEVAEIGEGVDEDQLSLVEDL